MKQLTLLFLLILSSLSGDLHLTLDVVGGTLTEKEETQSLARLAAWSLLLNDKEALTSLGQDIYPEGAIEITPIATRLHFHLKESDSALKEALLTFVKELPNTLPTLESINLAKALLKESYPEVELLTEESVLSFFQNSFQKERAELFVREEGKELQSTLLRMGEESAFTLAKELTVPDESGDELLLDGKILMKRPSWYQVRWWGKLVGALLFIGTAASVAVGTLFTFYAPYAVGAALLTFGGGSYYVVVNPYLNDPHVIKEKRQEDLQKGFKHSYKNGRLFYTLTPAERRTLFLLEILEEKGLLKQKLSDFPIDVLTDQFRLTDPLFRTILYPSELKSLLDLKDQFISARAQFWKERYQIEEELARFVAPHQVIRDLRLDSARKHYEANTAVIRQRSLQQEMGREINEVWVSWRKGMINTAERDSSIQQIEEHFATLMDLPEDQLELKFAWKELETEQQLILTQYRLAEENCKNMIHYHERMRYLELGKWGLYQRFSDFAVSLVKGFPPADPIAFPDFLDLTKRGSEG